VVWFIASLTLRQSPNEKDQKLGMYSEIIKIRAEKSGTIPTFIHLEGPKITIKF
jgi:hypothetical protein